jgi:hypothetical protein
LEHVFKRRRVDRRWALKSVTVWRETLKGLGDQTPEPQKMLPRSFVRASNAGIVEPVQLGLSSVERGEDVMNHVCLAADDLLQLESGFERELRVGNQARFDDVAFEQEMEVRRVGWRG